jgi:hypothetical protein
MEETQEVWKVIKDFPKYEVSTFGNVRHIEKQRNLKQTISKGYKYVGLTLDTTTRKIVVVHRLVAITFISNPDNKKTVNHKDHNPLNNNVTNLEWFTQKEQNNHSRTCCKEKSSLIGSRKVWRIDKITDEKLELYDSIRMAEKWVFDNKLSKLTEFSKFKTDIFNVAQGKNKTAYGYKWIYEQEENLNDEIWKPIPKNLVNNVDGFLISSLGRLKNKRGRITNGYKHTSGYLYVSVSSKTYRLHRLVAQVFLICTDQENKLFVNHKDGNKLNAKLSNLEWCTPQENSIHAIETGLVNRKKNLIQYDLNMIKLNEFNSIKEASEILNINYRSIGMCCNGQIKTAGGFIFKFINDTTNIANLKFCIRPVIQYNLNMVKLNEFKSQTEASKKLNISISSIGVCCRGKQKTAGGFIFKFKD